MSCHTATRSLLVFATLLFGGCGSGSSPTVTPSPVSQPPSAPVITQFLLDGYITDSLMKTGISAAVVDLQTSGGALVNEQRTDADGHFGFGSVQSGAYVLRVSAPGYDTSLQQLDLFYNQSIGIGLARSGITALMIAGSTSGTNMFCKPNGTTTSNVSLLNGSAFTVVVTFTGGSLGDPTTAGVAYNFTLSPSVTQTFSIVPGSYDSAGQSSDGKAVIEREGFVFSRGCDFAWEVCTRNNNRVCHP